MLSKFSLTHLFPLFRLQLDIMDIVLECSTLIALSLILNIFPYIRYIELDVMLFCDYHYWNQDVF